MENKEIALIGAGKLGTGLVGEIFDRNGYHIVFIDRSTQRIQQLRDQGYYTVKMVYRDDRPVEMRRIEGYEAYSSTDEIEQCIKRLSEVDLVCVQIYPDGVPDAIHMLSNAIKSRVEQNVDRPYNIIFCVNFVYPARIFHDGIEQEMKTEAQKAYFAKSVGFVDGLPRRGVYPPTPDMIAQDPLMVSADMITDVLPVGTTFVGPRPDMKDLEFVDRADGLLVQKIFVSNMSHCMLNASGYALLGATYTYQAASDPYIRALVNAARKEAVCAVAQEFGFNEEEMAPVALTPWKAMMNPESGDTTARGAGDPIRKLKRNDRLTGPGLLCIKWGMLPSNLARGTAMELMYDAPGDKNAEILQKDIAERGIAYAIEKYCELDLSQPDDKLWYQLVLAQYQDIQALRDAK